ncbi:MAG: hypothetical protein QXJ33_02735 [Acidilobaceae archaeon]
MGRRKRRKIRIKTRRVIKPLARYFQCPICSSMTLTIDFDKSDLKDKKVAVIMCGTCGLNCRLETSSLAERIDVYNRIADLAYDGRLEEECIREAIEGRGEYELEGEGMEEYIREEEEE